MFVPDTGGHCKTGRIQDQYMIPEFAAGDYSLGILQGFDAVLYEVYLEYGYEYEGTSDLPYHPGDDSEGLDIPKPVSILGIILVVVLIILDFIFTGGRFTFIILHILARSGGGRRGGGGSAGGGGSSRRW